MERRACPVRKNWQKLSEDRGFFFHTVDGKPYWREGACYIFTSAEIDALYDATKELHHMCMELVREVVRKKNFQAYGFPPEVFSVIEKSLNGGELGLCGRFDLAYNGKDIKLLEYNADTPTILPEAAQWQWQWLEDHRFPDQYNSIYEELVKRWPKVIPQRRALVHFSAMPQVGEEDWATVHYLALAAQEAGFTFETIQTDKIGWDADRRVFIDERDRPIAYCYKLYPWEWMMAERFGWNVSHAKTRFIEPAWKMLLSTKALLPLLWQKFPNHPLLLPAFFDKDAPRQGSWVRKPLLGREGANISFIENGASRPAPGSEHNPAYDRHGYVVQQKFDIPSFEGMRPVIGSWVVGDEPCGIGIREDAGIVGNESYFVPHYFTK